ncbi:MAG: ferredoxin [Pseudonocardia sp.]|uniref:ferredoxin n=1 Tax=unclassified Pseudonocardia TaxID=2619320 RepID=UPI00086E084D|nr:MULTISPECIES: ferredoxin [unclassified Pseudonocardia]MBN9109413.1 ferredoxin [Pseudonocardia sp.]ODU29943.1 MAG: ferredoxin [Pseudonocardia sp. SCN 72-51]ODV08119.1 MAG: ferredoxin [Pseudonocardia sp. SCN 73-27]
MRISVNYELCESNALCTAVAPDVFEIRDDGYLHFLDEDPPEAQRPAVAEAVQICPRAAITLES